MLSLARSRSSGDILRNIATNPLSTSNEFLVFVFLAIRSLFNDNFNYISRRFRVLSFVLKYLRNIAGLHAKVKICSRLRFGEHAGMKDKTLLNRAPVPKKAEHCKGIFNYTDGDWIEGDSNIVYVFSQSLLIIDLKFIL